MSYRFLIFTVLTAIVMAIILSPAQVESQAKAEQHFEHTDTDMKGPFLIFLSSEEGYCLGTLIHKQWVLTAAHCFLPFVEINVASTKKLIYRSVNKLEFQLSIEHPNFTRDSAENDLMLIKLKEPIQLNDEVKLPVLANTTNVRTGENCIVSGWGWTWWTPFTAPDIQVNQEVVSFPDEYCQISHTKEIPVEVSENTFCAGSSLDTIQSCTEVSAAPLLCHNQLQGILSWSQGCVLKGDIGYYTKISQNTDWILSVIRTY